MPETQQRNVRRTEAYVFRTYTAVVENVFVKQQMKARNGNPQSIGDFRLRKAFLNRSFRILHEVAYTPFLGSCFQGLIGAQFYSELFVPSSTLDEESGKLLGRLRT